MQIPEITFRRGTYFLNPDPNFNFQLNRTIQWNGGRLDDIAPVAATIRTAADWKNTLISLGDAAINEQRVENALGYYRMNEFFMFDHDPDKVVYYQKATTLFYDHYRNFFDSGLVERMQAPYESAALPILHVKAQGERKDVILLHGGNDSYMEEFFFPMLYLARCGFEAYLFEGPGQGGVVRIQGKKFTPRWEGPVQAVLDTTGETDVTIIGASLGGMLAPRAAAFEPERIRRVVGWSVFPNFLSVALSAMPQPLRPVLKWMIARRWHRPINAVLHRKMQQEPMLDWGIRHGMYAYDARDPFSYIQKLDDYKMTDIGPYITQDVLVLGADHDHFIPRELYAQELDALPQAQSLTFRLLTEKEDAGAHCNVGNPKLVLDTIMNWIEVIKARGLYFPPSAV